MRPDLSLIQDYTREAGDASRPVAVTHFENGSKHLYYINASHVTGIKNPTCETVRKAIQTYKPQLVIIEGIPTEDGVSPPSYVDYVNRKERPQNFPLGEPAYAAFLAIQNQIPFIGGEPSEETIHTFMAAEGYSARDLMAFYALRLIPQYRQLGKTIDEIFPQIAGDVDFSFNNVTENETLKLDELAAWYNQHRGSSGDLWTINTENFAPYSSSDASYFQSLNHKIGIVREQHIDTLIADSLINNDRVLVVYGDGHLVKSGPVFENMLGPGKLILLSNNQQEKLTNQAKLDLS